MTQPKELESKICEIILGKIPNPAWDYKAVVVTQRDIEKLLALFESELKAREELGYKRGVEDEIKCVETSGEHLDLQKKLNELKTERVKVIEEIQDEIEQVLAYGDEDSSAEFGDGFGVAQSMVIDKLNELKGEGGK